MKPLYLKLFTSYIFVALFFGNSYAQRIEKDSLVSDLPITYGELPNGFKYYIFDNPTDTKKIDIQLVVKTGYFYETLEEIEFAHLVEHMASKASVNFPNGIKSHLTKKGLIPGKNLNASTTDICTKYKILDIPSNDLGLIKDCMLVMRDRAQNLMLTEDSIKLESGAVLDEISMGDQETYYAYREKLAKIVDNKIYNPSNNLHKSKQNLKNINYKRLIDFYNKWYRPDLEALIIVGDVDIVQIENQIKVIFSDLNKPSKELPKALNISMDKYKGELKGENKIISVVGDNKKNIQFERHSRRRGSFAGRKYSLSDVRDEIYYDLFNKLISNRVTQSSERYDLPFQSMSHYISQDGLLPGSQLDILSTFMECSRPSDLKNAISETMLVLYQIEQYGFTHQEFTKVLQELTDKISGMKPDSKPIADQIAENFVYNTPLLRIESKKEIFLNILQHINFEKFNHFFSTWIASEENNTIVLEYPKEFESQIPDSTIIYNWIKEIKESNIKPYSPSNLEIDYLISRHKVDTFLEKPIIAKFEIPKINITRLVLQNGVNIYLKSIVDNNLPNNQRIVFTAFRNLEEKLLEQYNDESIFYSSSIVQYSGVGGFSKFQIENFLNKKSINFSTFLGGFSAYGDYNDFEDILQLSYLYFTKPTEDINAFKSYMRKLIYMKIKKSLNSFYQDSIKEIVNENNSRFSNLDVKKIDYESVLNFHNSSFSDPDKFSFVLTGTNIDLDSAGKIMAKYLGNLPSKKYDINKRTQQYGEHEYKKEENRFNHFVDSDREQTNIIIIYKYFPKINNSIYFQVLSKLLQLNLMEKLRYKVGGTYNVTVSNQSITNNQSNLRISFSTKPELCKLMVDSVNEEILELQSLGPDKDVFTTVINDIKNEYKGKLNDYVFWNRAIKDKIHFNEKLESILEPLSILENMTVENIKILAQEYLNKDNYFEFFIGPELN